MYINKRNVEAKPKVHMMHKKGTQQLKKEENGVKKPAFQQCIKRKRHGGLPVKA